MQNQTGNLTAISFSYDIFASYFLGGTKVGLRSNGEREGGTRTTEQWRTQEFCLVGGGSTNSFED